MLDIVSYELLKKNHIYYEDIFGILDNNFFKKSDYSDLYFQYHIHESWILENKIIKNGVFNIDEGIGLRSSQGEYNNLTYTNSISFSGLKKIFDTFHTINMCNISNSATKRINYINTSKQKNNVYSIINPLNIFTNQEKIDILYFIDNYARSYDSRVVDVNATLSGNYEEILIIATDGTIAADIRPLVRLSIFVWVEENGKRELGSSSGGGRYSYDFFLLDSKLYNFGNNFVEYLVHEAIRIALLNLYASSSLSGTFPVVLGPGWTGVLLHEAVGHGLEGDFNRKKTSLFFDKMNTKVASELCTIIDNSNLRNKRGSLNFDDEGVEGKSNILIKNGILKNYMLDKNNAKLMGLKSTGNARRTSYAYLPMPRMTNTYMLSGTSNPLDIINSVDYGLYASNFSGGQVDITSGEFVFETSEAYLIKNGKLSDFVKGAMLIGSGIQVMKDISMVGNDLMLDLGIGTCIKDGQSIPVGVGQPTIKIEKLTIGGS